MKRADQDLRQRRSDGKPVNPKKEGYSKLSTEEVYHEGASTSSSASSSHTSSDEEAPPVILRKNQIMCNTEGIPKGDNVIRFQQMKGIIRLSPEGFIDELLASAKVSYINIKDRLFSEQFGLTKHIQDPENFKTKFQEVLGKLITPLKMLLQKPKFEDFVSKLHELIELLPKVTEEVKHFVEENTSNEEIDKRLVSLERGVGFICDDLHNYENTLIENKAKLQLILGEHHESTE